MTEHEIVRKEINRLHRICRRKDELLKKIKEALIDYPIDCKEIIDNIDNEVM